MISDSVIIVAIVSISSISIVAMFLFTSLNKDKLSIKGSANVSDLMKGEIVVDSENNSEK
ncbi:hypothetical protein [Clostridium sp. C8-1-8]|uniref:hypothetical protein n=1 Tax=Clostridium sp. C8-1-8 TaxID=2698831 RepID=UPI0013699A96|nr:hypothetical protein [Clostridium sp. C8-1-8]